MLLDADQAKRLIDEYKSITVHPEYLKTTLIELGCDFLYESDVIVKVENPKATKGRTYRQENGKMITIKHLDLFTVSCGVVVLRRYTNGLETTLRFVIPITHLLLETLKEACFCEV